MGEVRRSVYEVLVWNLQGRDCFEDLVVGGRIVLKWTVRNNLEELVLDLFDSVMVFSEHDKEPAVSIKAGNFLTASSYRFLKNNCIV
jgi:hypothetical protein